MGEHSFHQILLIAMQYARAYLKWQEAEHFHTIAAGDHERTKDANVTKENKKDIDKVQAVYNTTKMQAIGEQKEVNAISAEYKRVHAGIANGIFKRAMDLLNLNPSPYLKLFCFKSIYQNLLFKHMQTLTIAPQESHLDEFHFVEVAKASEISVMTLHALTEYIYVDINYPQHLPKLRFDNQACADKVHHFLQGKFDKVKPIETSDTLFYQALDEEMLKAIEDDGQPESLLSTLLS